MMISSSFSGELAKQIVTWILEENFASRFPHLTLLINSPGGEVPAAFAIIDAMIGSTIPVHTVGIGQISSCGLLTFIAGTKGHRILTPNTTILSHQWAWSRSGKAHELMAACRQYDLTNEKMLRLYKTCTGLKKSEILSKLLPPEDVWLSAEEALELGICDKIKVTMV